jgi:hypothetical protein
MAAVMIDDLPPGIGWGRERSDAWTLGEEAPRLVKNYQLLVMVYVEVRLTLRKVNLANETGAIICCGRLGVRYYLGLGRNLSGGRRDRTTSVVNHRHGEGIFRLRLGRGDSLRR